MNSWLVLALSLLASHTASAAAEVAFSQSATSVAAYDFVEVTLQVSAPGAKNPFTEAAVSGWFGTAGTSERVQVDGFCDSPDGTLFRVRFMPSKPGDYAYAVKYSEKGYEKSYEGTFRATAASRRGPIRVDPEHRWHFIWEGTREHYFLNGTTAFWLMGWRDEMVIASSLERLRRLKINRVRVLLSGRANTMYGEPAMNTVDWSMYLSPWPAVKADDFYHPGFDYTRFHVEHWQRFERMLRYAGERDMVISVILDIADGQIHLTPGSEDERRYIRYATARFSAFSNITWDLGDDLDTFRDDKWAHETGTLLESWDPYRHLATTHPVHREHQDRGSEWFGFTSIQDWSRSQHALMLEERQLQIKSGRIIPQANEEYGYEDHYPLWAPAPPGDSAETLRKTAWDIAMAGAYGTAGETARRGVGIWPDTGGGWMNGRSDDTTTMLSGYAHMVDFLTSFEWWKTEPHDELVGAGNWCLAEPGQTYAVYLPKAGKVTVQMTPGRYRAEWFNPMTGTSFRLVLPKARPGPRRRRQAGTTGRFSYGNSGQTGCVDVPSSCYPAVSCVGSHQEIRMKSLTRRDVLKSGMAAPAATAVGMPVMAALAQSGQAQSAPAQSPLRERLLLDFGWRFHLGHANDATRDFDSVPGRSGAFQKTGGFLAPSNLAYDDSEWSPVSLPHDWAIGLPFKNDPALASKGSYPLGRDYPETSIGWYRRVLDVPASDAGRRISIEFDGSYRETMVVFNGYYIGRHSGGYDPFSFDLTDFALPGGPNVLLVRVDATLSDGWFYEGAGIYRHVWLVKTAPVHVKKWGTLAAAKVQAGQAALSIRTEIENQSKSAAGVRVISTVLDPSGKEVGKAATTPSPVPVLGERTCEQQLVVRQPALWSLDQRNLYKLVTEVESGGTVTDRYETRFGIRDLKFDPDHGLLLNGKPVKVKGTCNHQDHAGIGVALPDAVQYFRVRKLQEMGCNAIRTSHNPPTPELLEACDELGMLVLDETRMLSSSQEGIAQFENVIRRDRNHPSVFIWSMGNEESVSTTETGLKILTSMKQAALKHDNSRPVSIAPPPAGDYMGKGGLVVCDVMGYNYADPQAEAWHKNNPKVAILGTENVSAVGTRGAYVADRTKGTVSSYDPYTTTGRASAEGWWRFVSARPYISGGFVWTGFDYRGEPSPYQWPNISSQYGVIDTCGFPKDTFFYYQSWWTNKPVLHVFPHWNWPGLEGQEIAVWVHSNLDRVELCHNGQSLGAKDMQKDQHLAWNVKYAPGSIEARGFKDGKQALTAKRETTGPAARLVLRPDRQEISADAEDVAFFTVEVQDAQGRILPVTESPVTFKLTGSGKVIGTGNGDPTNHEPDPGSTRKAFAGLCMAIVQSTKTAGSLTVEATSPGLTTATATITSKAMRLRPQVAVWEREVPTGSGITGLWRPVITAAAAQTGNPMALAGGNADSVYSFRQNGNTLTGSVESSGGGGFGGGGATGGAIDDGKIDGSSISFRTGTTTYTGTIDGDRIELRRTGGPGGRGGRGAPPPAEAGPRPAIGPPPAGSDPSFGAGGGGRGGPQAPAPIVLRRAKR